MKPDARRFLVECKCCFSLATLGSTRDSTSRHMSAHEQMSFRPRKSSKLFVRVGETCM